MHAYLFTLFPKQFLCKLEICGILKFSLILHTMIFILIYLYELYHISQVAIVINGAHCLKSVSTISFNNMFNNPESSVTQMLKDVIYMYVYTNTHTLIHIHIHSPYMNNKGNLFVLNVFPHRNNTYATENTLFPSTLDWALSAIV